MKYFSWNSDKNASLKKERGIGFEIVVYQIQQGKCLDILEHPNKRKYKDQRLFVVEWQGYAYLVPFVEDDQQIFLKTIIPSRKATQKYLKG